MARNQGTFNFAANFEGNAKSPIDARQQVGTYADLTTPSTWNQSGNVWLFDGAIVAVSNDPDTSKNGIYFLKDADNYTVASNWVQLASSEATSGDTTYDTVWMSGETETGITLKTWYDVTQSAGRISGGTITEGTTGTVNVSAGAGLIKETDDRIGVNRYVTWNTVTNLPVSTGYNFIYYDANLGAIQATTDEAEIEANDNFNLGRVYYDSTIGLIVRLCGQNLWNLNRRLHLYGDQVYGVQRASGMIISNPTGLQIAVTGGVLWAELLNRFTTSGFTSASDNFYRWYYDSGSWDANEVTAPGSLNNTQWNDRSGSGALSALTGSYYTLRWVYVLHDSSVHVVWGDAEYSGLTEALLETAPADLPDVISGYGTLVGRVVVQDGNSNAVETTSAFEQVFATSTVQAHNDLSGIQGGAPGEYYHLDNADILAVNAALTGGTNGLTETVGREVKLGGTALCEATSIPGASFDMSLGTSGSNLGNFDVYASGDITANGAVIGTSTLNISGATHLDSTLRVDGVTTLNSVATGSVASDCILVRDSNGVVKQVESCTVGITTATNGVSLDGDNFVLGGTLTGNTDINYGTHDLRICSSTGNNAGLRICGDGQCAVLGTNWTSEGSVRTSFTDVYICSNEFTLSNCDNCQELYVSSGGFEVRDELANKGLFYNDDYNANYTCLSIPHVGYVTGLTNGLSDRVDTIEADYITGGTSGLEVDTGNHDLKLGGTLTEDTNLSGSYLFGLNVNEIRLTGATVGVKIDGNTFLCDLTGADDLVCINTTTGELGTTSLSAFGGITGGTNGICDHGNQNLGLGGALIEATTIDGDFDLCLGTAASNLNTLQVFTEEGITLDSDQNLILTVSGGTITTDDGEGLKYSGAYENSFVDASLVSKCYVDTVATGLQPHDTVLVATTANITLSGTQTIDGVALTGGERVLVKDQTSGATNGIYVVAAGAWSRAADFDGTPVGEVVNGDLVPVESGNTNANTIWVLTTPDPIDVGTTDLDFTLFSRLLGISAGDGIDVTPQGSTQQVSVDLAANGGLCIVSTELSIDDTIAGNGLTWSTGVLNVNAVSGEGAISVKYNGSDNLVIATADVNTALGGVLTGATNGLTDASGCVCLGGELTTATSICGSVADSCGLTYEDLAITNQRGIVYADDYSDTFIDNSLVSKKYVDDCMSASAITAGVGLTDTAGTFDVNITDAAATGTEVPVCIDSGGNNVLYVDSADITNDTLVAAGGNTIDGTGITLKYNGSNQLVVDSDDIQALMTGVTAGLGLTENAGAFDVCAEATIAGTAICAGLTGLEEIAVDAQEITNVLGGGSGTSDIQLPAYYGDGTTYSCERLVISAQDVANAVFPLEDGDADIEVKRGDGIAYNCDQGVVNSCDVAAILAANGEFAGTTVIPTYYGDGVSGCNPNQLVIDAADVQAAMTGNTFTNGLTETSGAVCLGGTLTENTTILGDGSYGITFGDFNDRTDFDNFSVYGYTVNLYGRNAVFVEGGATGVGIKSDSGLTQTLNLCAGDICVTGLATYAADYSGSYTSRSIPDVEYVTGLTSGGITSANNGLTKDGQNVRLGGDLTGVTTINTDSYDFEICDGTNDIGICLNSTAQVSALYATDGAGACTELNVHLNYIEGYTENNASWQGFRYANGFSTDVGSPQTCSIPDKGYVDTCVGNIESSAITGATNGIGTTGQQVCLGGDLTADTNIGGAYTLGFHTTAVNITGTLDVTGTTTLGSVASGSTTDEVLTITSGGEIQKISADSLGEDNNIYATTGITGNTTLGANQYAVLVESSEGAITITLPTGATDGQAYKIKDVDGDALTNNITISGNGNNIDGSPNVTINTDYGALEVVYDDTLEAWFVLSFVN